MAMAEKRRSARAKSAVSIDIDSRSATSDPSQKAATSAWQATTAIDSQAGCAAAAWPVSVTPVAAPMAPTSSSALRAAGLRAHVPKTIAAAPPQMAAEHQPAVVAAAAWKAAGNAASGPASTAPCRQSSATEASAAPRPAPQSSAR